MEYDKWIIKRNSINSLWIVNYSLHYDILFSLVIGIVDTNK